jgi:hypothetical protein
MGRTAERVSEVVVAGARAAARALPSRVVKGVEDRIFWYIFQKTRVENDAYGWRPPPPGGEAPPEHRREPGAPPRAPARR